MRTVSLKILTARQQNPRFRAAPSGCFRFALRAAGIVKIVAAAAERHKLLRFYYRRSISKLLPSVRSPLAPDITGASIVEQAKLDGGSMTRRNEAGQVLVFAALGLGILLGAAGLGVDVGALRYQKRVQQTAADAAAIVGANNLAYGSGVTTGAQHSATTNGYTDASSNDVSQCASSTASVGLVCVQVNNGPSYLGATDPHNGDAKYVEVVVSTVQPTYFMKIFGVNQKTVTARAVATSNTGGGPASNCMYTLGLPAKEIGVDINGHPTLNAPTCGISDNGNFNTKGNALTVNAGSFAVSGASNQSGPGGSVNCQYQVNCPSFGAPTVADPLASLTPPPVGTPVAWNPASPAPGTYNGITIGTNTVFPPGIYVVSGGNFNCNGSPTITGTGVMFYFTQGATINCTGSAQIDLTAPTASNCPACPSQYDGILMYQDPADTTNGVGNACPPGSAKGPQLGGNTGSSYNGVLYFPADQVWLFGNSGTISFDVVVTDSVCLTGNATFNMNGTAGLPTPIPALSNAILVE
jgi:Flp pilus assembly protein TadG